MKQKSIIALLLGAVLVLTLSSAESVFADYDEQYDDDYDESERYDDSEHDDKDKDCDKDDSEDDDRYEKERS